MRCLTRLMYDSTPARANPATSPGPFMRPCRHWPLAEFMWDANVETLPARRTRRYLLRCDGSPLSYGDALRHWQDDSSFRSFFTALLAHPPYPAFRWETPPLTPSTASRPFEFVLLDAPGLERSPDPEAFADHLTDASPGGSVAAFANLGNDAVLVVPRGDGPPQ